MCHCATRYLKPLRRLNNDKGAHQNAQLNHRQVQFTAGACIFLKNGRCSVYDARPTQCRTYPFWPGIVARQDDYWREARHCEGIAIEIGNSTGRGGKFSDEPSIVPAAEVTLQLMTKAVHAGGGPDGNMTYDEARALLEAVREAQPALVVEFEEDYKG